MAEPRPLQFAAQAYTSSSLPLDAQVCINMFVERSPPDAKTQVPVYGCPGIAGYISLGNGPILGLYNFNFTLLIVSGQQLYSLVANESPILLGGIGLVGRPSISDNGHQVVFVDGVTGWIYQPGGVNFETSFDAAEGSYFLFFPSTQSMAVGDTVLITLDDDTLTSSVASATVAAPGSGGTDGPVVLTVVGGTGTAATLNGTIAGGALSAINSVATGGGYTVFPSSPAMVTGGGLAGATVDLTELPFTAGTFATTITAITDDQIITLANSLPGSVAAGNIVVDPAVLVAQITSPNFHPAKTVTYFDTYFVFDWFMTSFFFISDSDDGTMYNSTFVAQAEADPDVLLGVNQIHELLMLLGSKHIETWYDAGTLDFPFARFDGGTIQRGIAGPRAFVNEDNTFFWLGDDIVFYRLESFTPKRVSTHALEAEWQSYSQTGDAFCMATTWNGHKWIFVTFPSGGTTFVYDVSSGLWHQRISWTAQNQPTNGWRIQALVVWADMVVCGDSLTNQLGFFNRETFTDFGMLTPAIITSPPVHNARARTFQPIFEVDMETGVGGTVTQLNPQVVMDWSDDGSRTWSQVKVPKSIGPQGAYLTRLRWSRMGQARQRVYRLTITDPVKRAIIGTYLLQRTGLP
jgi:hypothetical protein